MKQEKKNNVALFSDAYYAAYVGCYENRTDALAGAFNYVESAAEEDRPDRVRLVFLNTGVIEELQVVLKVQLIETPKLSKKRS